MEQDIGHWNYEGGNFDTENYYGFIYKITNAETDEYYIGRKNFYSTTTKQPLKGKKRKRKITKESKWRTYRSSQKDLQELISANPDNFLFDIIELCPSKLSVTYSEVKHLFRVSCLDDEKCLNKNILGRFYTSK